MFVTKFIGNDRVALTDMYSLVIRELFPKVTLPKAKKGAKPVFLDETEGGKHFLERYCMLVRKNLMRNLKSKTRQHRNAT